MEIQKLLNLKTLFGFAGFGFLLIPRSHTFLGVLSTHRTLAECVIGIQLVEQRPLLNNSKTVL
jgi:hypothetical protein